MLMLYSANLIIRLCEIEYCRLSSQDRTLNPPLSLQWRVSQKTLMLPAD